MLKQIFIQNLNSSNLPIYIICLESHILILQVLIRSEPLNFFSLSHFSYESKIVQAKQMWSLIYLKEHANHFGYLKKEFIILQSTMELQMETGVLDNEPGNIHYIFYLPSFNATKLNRQSPTLYKHLSSFPKSTEQLKNSHASALTSNYDIYSTASQYFHLSIFTRKLSSHFTPMIIFSFFS